MEPQCQLFDSGQELWLDVEILLFIHSFALCHFQQSLSKSGGKELSCLSNKVLLLSWKSMDLYYQFTHLVITSFLWPLAELRRYGSHSCQSIKVKVNTFSPPVHLPERGWMDYLQEWWFLYRPLLKGEGRWYCFGPCVHVCVCQQNILWTAEQI